MFSATPAHYRLLSMWITSHTWISWPRRSVQFASGEPVLLCKYEGHIHIRPPITGRSSTKPSGPTPERPCALAEGRLWSLHSVSVSSHWTRTMGRSPTRYPHSVEAGCSAFQNPSGTRTKAWAICLFPPWAAHIGRKCDNGCTSVEKSSSGAGFS